MSRQQLAARLYALAIDGLREANKGNPFISKSDAFKSVNRARGLK